MRGPMLGCVVMLILLVLCLGGLMVRAVVIDLNTPKISLVQDQDLYEGDGPESKLAFALRLSNSDLPQNVEVYVRGVMVSACILRPEEVTICASEYSWHPEDALPVSVRFQGQDWDALKTDVVWGPPVSGRLTVRNSSPAPTTAPAVLPMSVPGDLNINWGLIVGLCLAGVFVVIVVIYLIFSLISGGMTNRTKITVMGEGGQTITGVFGNPLIRTTVIDERGEPLTGRENFVREGEERSLKAAGKNLFWIFTVYRKYREGG